MVMVVTMEALAPFRCAAYDRPSDDPTPLPYLASPANEAEGGFDVKIEVSIASEQMRNDGTAPHTLAVTNMQNLYWTIFQMLTHHTSNGCNLRPGDMMGTGTISGQSEDALGSILEITKRGANPVALPSGEERKFLGDGDELIMRAWCERDGARFEGALIGVARLVVALDLGVGGNPKRHFLAAGRDRDGVDDGRRVDTLVERRDPDR